MMVMWYMVVIWYFGFSGINGGYSFPEARHNWENIWNVVLTLGWVAMTYSGVIGVL